MQRAAGCGRADRYTTGNDNPPDFLGVCRFDQQISISISVDLARFEDLKICSRVGVIPKVAGDRRVFVRVVLETI